MSLTPTDRAELARLSAGPLTIGWPAIHFLCALYARFGTQSAREVTDVIGESTASPTAGYFSGFIAGTDSTGFNPAVADPNISNPQTGHFFSFVIWALNGISEFEAAAALGHEFVTDGWFVAQAEQLSAGIPDAADFRDLIVRQPLDARGNLDYASLDSEFSDHGWTGRIVETETEERIVPGLSIVSRHDYYTGNSVADLRCTVAGFHFGRLVRSGLFGTSADAAAWLTRNLLDGPCHIGFAAGVAVLAGTGGGR